MRYLLPALLLLVIVAALMWRSTYRQRYLDWRESRFIRRRRRRAIRLRLPQKADMILTNLGKPMRNDVGFVYHYIDEATKRELGSQESQDPKTFDYQGDFTLLNRRETIHGSHELFSFTYKGGLAYEYCEETVAREQRQQQEENIYAGEQLFVAEEEKVGISREIIKLVVVAGEYSANNSKGECIAIYAPRDEHAYDEDEGIEMVMICLWKAAHKERYKRARRQRMDVYAWPGDILLYFPGEWEGLLGELEQKAYGKIGRIARERADIAEESLRRRFFRPKDSSELEQSS